MEPITHLQDKKRFEITEDGYTAYVAYELFEGGIDITHTLVPKPLEGRGLASERGVHKSVQAQHSAYGRAGKLCILPYLFEIHEQ